MKKAWYYALENSTSRQDMSEYYTYYYKNKDKFRTNWLNIGRLATFLNVEPEAIIDERYYYGKCGMASYRLICQAYRVGKTPENLLDKTREREKACWGIDDPNRWRDGVRSFLLGYQSEFPLKSPKPRYYGVFLWLVLDLCASVDFPPSELFRPYRTVISTDTAFSEIHSALTVLSASDMVILAGMAQALASTPANKPSELKKALNLLVAKRKSLGGASHYTKVS